MRWDTKNMGYKDEYKLISSGGRATELNRKVEICVKLLLPPEASPVLCLVHPL